jgi:uncharacterized LabA/DUF88 family protein
MIPDDARHAVFRDRIGLFIDGWHLTQALKVLNLQFDYGKLIRYFQTRGHVGPVNYYSSQLPGPVGMRGKALVQWLGCHGYSTIVKEAKCFIDENGIRHVKNYLEIDMVLDMIEMASCLDHIVLFAGLGNLCRPIQAVQRNGTRVTVVSTVQGPAPMAAWSLRRQADRFEDLVDLVPLIARMPPSTNEVL